MNIEIKTRKDYSIIQIGFDEDIRLDMQQRIQDIYIESAIPDFSLHYPFEIDQLEEWIDILDWVKISSNKQLKWSGEILRKYQDKFNWTNIGFNISIQCWNEYLLEEFQDKLNWETIIFSSIDWNQSLHEKFKKFLPHFYNYDLVKKETNNNRNIFEYRPTNDLSSQFSELYNYAKSINEEKGIFILYDAIQEFFDKKKINKS